MMADVVLFNGQEVNVVTSSASNRELTIGGGGRNNIGDEKQTLPGMIAQTYYMVGIRYEDQYVDDVTTETGATITRNKKRKRNDLPPPLLPRNQQTLSKVISMGFTKSIHSALENSSFVIDEKPASWSTPAIFQTDGDGGNDDENADKLKSVLLNTLVEKASSTKKKTDNLTTMKLCSILSDLYLILSASPGGIGIQRSFSESDKTNFSLDLHDDFEGDSSDPDVLTWSDHFQILLDRAPTFGNAPPPLGAPSEFVAASATDVDPSKLPKNIHSLPKSVQRRYRHQAMFPIKWTPSQKVANRIYGTGDWDPAKGNRAQSTENLGGFNGILLDTSFENGFQYNSSTLGSDLLGCLLAIGRGCVGSLREMREQNLEGEEEQTKGINARSSHHFGVLLELTFQNLNLLLGRIPQNMRFAVNVENWAMGALVAEVANHAPIANTRVAAIHIMNGMVTCVCGEAPDLSAENDQDEGDGTILTSPIYTGADGNVTNDYIIDYSDVVDENDDNLDVNSTNLCWDVSGRSQREFRFLSVAAARVSSASHSSSVYSNNKDDSSAALSGASIDNNDDRSFFYDYPPAGGGFLNEQIKNFWSCPSLPALKKILLDKSASNRMQISVDDATDDKLVVRAYREVLSVAVSNVSTVGLDRRDIFLDSLNLLTNIASEACKLVDDVNGVRDLLIEFDLSGKIVAVVEKLVKLLTVGCDDGGDEGEREAEEKAAAMRGGGGRHLRIVSATANTATLEQKIVKYVYDSELAFSSATALRYLGYVFNHEDSRSKTTATLQVLRSPSVISPLANMFLGIGYNVSQSGPHSVSAMWRSAGEAIVAIFSGRGKKGGRKKGEEDSALLSGLVQIDKDLVKAVTKMPNNASKMATDKETFYFNYISPLLS